MTPHPVLNPFQLGGQRLRNRTVVAPLSRVSTVGNGVPTAAMASYYHEFALGGFGLIISEGIYTDRTYAQAYANQPGLTDEAQLNGWCEVVGRVHSAGAKMIGQLMHAGALSQCLKQPAGPSAIRPLGQKMKAYGGYGSWPVPKAMVQDEIEEVIRGFAATALRAVQAGFDGVEIHGANGYLIDQFLTDYTNQRDDRFGGDRMARASLAVETVRAVKRAVPASFLVGIRLSQGKVNDFDYRWPDGQHGGRVLFSLLADAGVDYLHFASEGKGYQHGCVLEDGTVLPELARNLTGLPVIVNGGMHQPGLAADVLAQGHADLIALGTGAIANPDWPERLSSKLPMVPFNLDMLSPDVTIESTWIWRLQHPSPDLVKQRDSTIGDSEGF